jgi:hypothetical protein
MKKFLPALILGLVTAVFVAPPLVNAQVIYSNNFDQYTTERVYTDSDLDSDFNNPVFNDGVTEGRVTIVGASEAFGGSGSALCVSYPAGMDGTKDTGAQWQLDLGADYEELVLKYRVRFGDGFDFVRGGKLPGLAGGSAPTGSTQANGTNGWTGRMMWRTDFEGVSGQPEQLVSDAISYAKYTDSGFDQDGRQEDKLYWTDANQSRTVINSGVWYEITQRVKMNTPGERNGVLQIFLDGVLVVDQQDVLFRTTGGTFQIDQMYFSTFFGGNEDWRTSKDEVAYFDDFEISVPEDSGTGPEPQFIKVPEHYATIQEAVDAANPGDTVAVRGEHRANVTIHKAIFIRGYDGTKVNARNRKFPVFKILCDGVHLKRFDCRFGPQAVWVAPRLRDIKVEFVKSSYNTDAGIRLNGGCDGAWLSKNKVFFSEGDGIKVLDSDDVELVDNKSYFAEKAGFYVFRSDGTQVEGNIAWGNHVGFNLGGSGHTIDDNFGFKSVTTSFRISGDHHLVVDNFSRLNGLHGYSFIDSSFNTVTSNVSRENDGNGFEFRYLSDGNIVTDNLAKIGGGIGFYIHLSNSNVIDDAQSLDNVKGFFLSASTANNTVKRSLASDNELYGFRDLGADNSLDQNIDRRNGR